MANISIYNCTFYNAGTYGITATGNEPFIYCYNTAICDSSVCFDATNPTIDGDYNASSDSTAPGSHSLHSINASNQFLDLTSGQFDCHLKETSDLVDAGTDLSWTGFDDDIDGDTRPSGSWDIGADEYVASEAVYSLVYNEFKHRNSVAEIDLDNDTIKARLLMTNTTCDTENDGISVLSDFSNIDACDATGYSDVTLTGVSVVKDDSSDRAILQSNAIVFDNLGGDASRDYQGILLYKYIGADNQNKPIAYIGFTESVPKTKTKITVNCSSDGWVYFD